MVFEKQKLKTNKKKIIIKNANKISSKLDDKNQICLDCWQISGYTFDTWIKINWYEIKNDIYINKYIYI